MSDNDFAEYYLGLDNQNHPEPHDPIGDLIQPPFSREAEQSVIGGILIDPNKLDEVSEILQESDFYCRGHDVIYGIMLSMASDNQPIDTFLLCDVLDRVNRPAFEEFGGLPYIMTIQKNTPGSSNISSYAKAVRDKSLERKLMTTGNEIVQMAFGDGSAEEKVCNAQEMIMNMEATTGENVAQANAAIKTVVDQIEERFQRKGEMVGLPTGLKELDRKLQGLREPDLIIVAGRPGMGKTTIAMNIAEHTIRAGKGVLVFSMEMSKEQLMERMVASVGNLDFGRVRSGQLEEADWPKLSAGVGGLKDMPLYIDDRAALSIQQMQSTARKIKRSKDISLLVVDYIQLAKAKGANRNHEIAEITAGLKAIAKELKIPVIALSQLNRDCEKGANKRPNNSHLRDSGAIEQDADIIFFMYRDEVYNEDSERKGIAEINITKFRNGETGTVCVASRLDVCKFDNLMHEPPPLSEVGKGGAGFNY